MMTLLEVPFAEKEQAKSLGARWNPAEKKWYVPEDLSDQIASFQKWLPSTSKVTNNPSNDSHSFTLEPLQTKNQGISLSQLMGKVQGMMRQSFPGALWIQAEIANINERRGHWYFELSEMNTKGQPVASCRAMIWQAQVSRIIEQFKLATGVALQAGQKILLLAEVTFHEKFGFSLAIQDIDPAFTLGELEANLNKIRQQLIKEQLYDLNKQYKIPNDFFRIAVIAPPNAAGLGDFRVDADLLQTQKLCEFHYFYAAFQGEKVETEMLAALDAFYALHKAHAFDALVIIRGGGAKLDLNPLNVYSLAKWIATVNLPVLTGIGHERDTTILDEVAGARFDTPSKVIGFIRQAIFSTSQQARQHWEMIEKFSYIYIQDQKQALMLNEQKVKQASLLLIQQQKHALTPLMIRIQQYGESLLKAQKNTIKQYQDTMILQVKNQLHFQKQQLQQYQNIIAQRPLYLINQAKEKNQQQMAYILTSGPKTQLSRGFALVKGTKQQPITSAVKAMQEPTIHIEFKDGSIEAKPVIKNQKDI